MYEDKTYKNLLKTMLDKMPNDINKNEGEVSFDHLAPTAFLLANVYTDLSANVDLIDPNKTTGKFLENICSQYGIYRKSPIKCKRKVTFVGATPLIGARFFARDTITYFTLIESDLLQAEQGGESPNSIQIGTELMPVNDIMGLKSAKIGEIVLPGADIQSYESMREDLKERIAYPAENNNIYHYKKWSKEIEGVGDVKIIPVWNGPNTVKAVLLGTDKNPATKEVVEKVQEYIDPLPRGHGNGRSDIGATLTTVSASPLVINLSITVKLSATGTIELVTQQINDILDNYLKEIAFVDDVVRIVIIGARCLEQANIIDYGDLKLNGQEENINIGLEQVAVKGMVSINVI